LISWQFIASSLRCVRNSRKKLRLKPRRKLLRVIPAKISGVQK
jgi:putative transposase